MTGRQENSLKIEAKIEKLLEGQPDILAKYYRSVSAEGKTSQTKKVYVYHLIEYFNYLIEHGINPGNVNSYKRIRKADIAEYIEATKYRRDKFNNLVENGESIRRGRIIAIKSFYGFLYENEYIDFNPCDKVKMPPFKDERNVVALTDKEINTIKERIIMDNTIYRDRDLAIFTLGIRTGLRVTAITEINIEDVNFDENFITVTEKGNKRRDVYFGNDTKEALLRWIANRGYVDGTNALFINKRKERISRAVAGNLLKKYAYGFNKKITPHKMRATCATTLYDKTKDIYLVADVLGHKNIANTRRYADISEKRRREAAGILDTI